MRWINLLIYYACSYKKKMLATVSSFFTSNQEGRKRHVTRERKWLECIVHKKRKESGRKQPSAPKSRTTGTIHRYTHDIRSLVDRVWWAVCACVCQCSGVISYEAWHSLNHWMCTAMIKFWILIWWWRWVLQER